MVVEFYWMFRYFNKDFRFGKYKVLGGVYDLLSLKGGY